MKKVKAITANDTEKKRTRPLSGNISKKKNGLHKKMRKIKKVAKPIDKKELSKVKASSNWEAFLRERAQASSQKEKTGEKNGTITKLREKTGRKRKSSKIQKSNISDSEKDYDVINEKDIWFDDVDIEDIEHATGKKVQMAASSKKPLKEEKETTEQAVTIDTSVPKDASDPRITKYLAVDCEMVGVGIDGKDNMLARVSLVNSFGETVYDNFVLPMQKVVDYRTDVSGVRADNLRAAPTFKTVQEEVASLTKKKILVGHAINHDLKVLLLSHPRKDIRDTSTYKPFKKLLQTRYPSLKKLVKEVLQIDIQSGEHSSVEDARCTMKIFQLHRKQWEKSLKEKGKKGTISLTPKIFICKDNNKVSSSYRKRKKERQSEV
eukprot:gene16743-18437_t